MKKKDSTVKIHDKASNTSIDVTVDHYYKLFCRKKVSKCFYMYKKCFVASSIELADLRQEIYLMLWQILVKNAETKKISKENLGGYLYNATQWQLNNLVSKAMTIYKLHLKNIDTVEVADSIYEEEPLKKSEVILKLFSKEKDEKFLDIIKKVCTEKEAITLQKYFYNSENSVSISKSMEISPQRVSALIKEGLLKLNYYFTQFVQRSKDE